MNDLWTLEAISGAVGGELDLESGAGNRGVSSLSIDTRTLEAGALYVAIKGVRQDGHEFVKGAFEAGAGGALVSSEYQAGPDDGPLIRVADTLKALEDLGRAARARALGARVIAVTGSAGKTGTKEALALMLGQCGKTHASVKSFNNHWGVPLSLARMPAETEFAVFEVGMNHAGEITPLTKLIAPDVALITTVAPVHIGHFANEEAIADAKAEIFTGLQPGGVAVLPVDNPHYPRLVAKAKAAGVTQIVGFGQAANADARLIEGIFGPEGSRAVAEISGVRVDFEVGLPGAHIVMNLIGALAAFQLVGGDLSQAASAIRDLEPPQGRGVRGELNLPGGAALLIDESYNANPASMRVALENLSQYQGATHLRRIAVIGDMLELGDLSRGYHEELAQMINDLKIEKVFAAGEMMQHMFNKLESGKQGGFMASSEGLEEMVEKNLLQGDVVMVKGSLGSDMGRVVKHLQARF